MTIDDQIWKANVGRYRPRIRGRSQEGHPGIDGTERGRLPGVPVFALKPGAGFFRWRPVLQDADDDRILEVAVRCQAMIVTFNKSDFAGAVQFGIRVITPGEFLAMLKERP